MSHRLADVVNCNSLAQIEGMAHREVKIKSKAIRQIFHIFGHVSLQGRHSGSKLATVSGRRRRLWDGSSPREVYKCRRTKALEVAQQKLCVPHFLQKAKLLTNTLFHFPTCSSLPRSSFSSPRPCLSQHRAALQGNCSVQLPMTPANVA